MAKAPTTQISLKLPTDLLERLRARADRDGTTVSALLIAGVDGNAAIDPRVAELEAENRDLQRKLMDALKALVDAKHPLTSTAEGRRLARAVDPLSRHPSGPVLASAAPEVAGKTPWCGLKGIDKPKR